MPAQRHLKAFPYPGPCRSVAKAVGGIRGLGARTCSCRSSKRPPAADPRGTPKNVIRQLARMVADSRNRVNGSQARPSAGVKDPIP